MLQYPPFRQHCARETNYRRIIFRGIARNCRSRLREITLGMLFLGRFARLCCWSLLSYCFCSMLPGIQDIWLPWAPDTMTDRERSPSTMFTHTHTYIYIYGHRPLCGPDFGRKSHFFPSFIVKMAKKKSGVDPPHFLRILPGVLLFWGGKSHCSPKSLEKCEFFECSVFSGT